MVILNIYLLALLGLAVAHGGPGEHANKMRRTAVTRRQSDGLPGNQPVVVQPPAVSIPPDALPGAT